MDRRESRRPISGSDDNPKKLILAAAACAEDGEPAPPELFAAWQIKRWGAGAVYSGEIPARDLRRMTVATNVYNAFESYRANAHRFADWAQSNPKSFEIVADVREMRKHAR